MAIILVVTIVIIMVKSPKTKIQTVRKKITEIYTPKAYLYALVSGLVLGALFTFYPPFVRTEPLTWQLACEIFLIAIVGSFIVIPPIRFVVKKLHSKIDKGDDNEQPQN